MKNPISRYILAPGIVKKSGRQKKSMLLPRAGLLCLAVLYLSFFQNLYGQKSRKQIEKEKKENLRKLAQTSQILKEVKKEKKASLSQLQVLRQQSRLKERNIRTIQDELGILRSDIDHLSSEEERLAFTLQQIRREYAAMVYAASKATGPDRFLFLLASETFHQFRMRLRCLRDYAEARRTQAARIRELSASLNQQKIRLAEVKAGKETLLVTQEEEKKQLEVLREDQKKVVAELSARERELKEKIDRHKASVARLEKLLSGLVKAEIKRSRKAGGAAPAPAGEESPDQKMTLTPEGQIISRSFAGNKKRLAWPVQNGFISSGFGRHEHPVLKRVYVDNLGVDIATRGGEKVRSVFEGEVGLVGAVPGMDGQIVMLRHGEYFTVYSGLKNIQVSAGQKIKTRQVLGEVLSTAEDGAVLQFQVWRNNKRLNPADWLAND